ncbi:MAG: TonB-dependent receptor [Myxococcota bacterium]|nr:TonB-dependent receptor [Myxococcota bacterium]
MCASCASPAHAAAPDRPGAVSVIPPQLLRQASPTYPAEALETRRAGQVSVLVDVGPDGAVLAVRFEAGPPVFAEAAVEAARSLRFAPATQGGAPIGVTTRVTFDFTPPDDGSPGGEDVAGEIIVHAEYLDHEGTQARTTLDADALERSAGEDLAVSLSAVPGVSVAGGTTDASKPIIRGQQERRLLVLYDGVRHESQKWGPDHATEIDPFAAGEISVIRGAAGARYGPDAIGGVILVSPPALRRDPGVGGRALASYASNGQRPYGAVRLDYVPEALPDLTIRAEGNYARGANLSAPDYVIGNTASEQWNSGVAAGWRWGSGQARIGWHHYDYRAGVFYGVQHGTPSDFEAQLDADQPVTAYLWTTTYDIDRPYQDVTHDVVSLHVLDSGSAGTIELTYAFQHNHREEYDEVRGYITGSQFDFILRTHSLDALYTHPVRPVRNAALEGGLGLQGIFQENVYYGLTLTPNYRGVSGGLFGFERASWDRFDLEVAARYDRLHRTAFIDRLGYQRHERRETLGPDDCTLDEDNDARCPARYDAGTFTVGGLFHIVPEHVDLKMDLSSASRFPNVDELYLIGSAPTFPVYALGDPTLGVETSWSGSTTVGLRAAGLTAEASAFGSYVDDYIYFSPERNADGSLHYDVTIRGTYPTYAYQSIDATIYGFDGGVALLPDALVGLDAGGGIVRAQHAGTGEQLIGTPADNVRLTASLRPRPRGRFQQNRFSLTSRLVAQQSRTDLDADFAPPPPGYVLLGAAAESVVALPKRDLRVGIEGHNLLDTAYREYTSLLRYYADQPGRDIRLRVGFDL